MMMGDNLSLKWTMANHQMMKRRQRQTSVPPQENAQKTLCLLFPQPATNGNTNHDLDFEEDIVVTRQEEERDPEAEADFDRELAKMMSESLDSRKFDRKPIFDVPLPMRRPQKETPITGEESGNEGTATPPSTNTMAFSLMTKKGNRQQVRLILQLFSLLKF